MELLSYNEYDEIIVSYSGGKDSTACLLYLLDLGVPKEKISLWHQCIDGKGETKREFFDWPSTEGYVKAIARHFGVALHWQWRAYGMHGEMYRENSLTKNVWYEGEWANIPIELKTSRGKETTRRKFPAKSPDLNTRWCSAYLKIDVARRVLSHKFNNGEKILFVTGERREESANRAKYNKIELHATNSSKRLVHSYRPIIDWEEGDVWRALEKHNILPHPVYYLGFPRLSCRSCIFFSKDHWATLNEVDPKVIKMLKSVEEEFGFTLDNKFSVAEMAQLGKSSITDENRHWIPLAVNPFSGSVYTRNWKLPLGAYGSGGGSI